MMTAAEWLEASLDAAPALDDVRARTVSGLLFGGGRDA